MFNPLNTIDLQFWKESNLIKSISTDLWMTNSNLALSKA